jgi:protein-S-isoprenylcysteine O-methyltransferase Ste14
VPAKNATPISASGSEFDLHDGAVAGWLLVMAGVALYLTCAFWGFALRGKGTPAPFDPPSSPIPRSNTWDSARFDKGQPQLASLEEPTLKRKFGAEYEAYCRQVPRWIPRFRNKLD